MQQYCVDSKSLHHLTISDSRQKTQRQVATMTHYHKLLNNMKKKQIKKPEYSFLFANVQSLPPMIMWLRSIHPSFDLGQKRANRWKWTRYHRMWVKMGCHRGWFGDVRKGKKGHAKICFSASGSNLWRMCLKYVRYFIHINQEAKDDEDVWGHMACAGITSQHKPNSQVMTQNITYHQHLQQNTRWSGRNLCCRTKRVH